MPDVQVVLGARFSAGLLMHAGLKACMPHADMRPKFCHRQDQELNVQLLATCHLLCSGIYGSESTCTKAAVLQSRSPTGVRHYYWLIAWRS